MPRGIYERKSRSDKSRDAEMRQDIGAEERGRLHIDSSILDPEKQYLWMTESCLGAYDAGNVQDRIDMDGYSPVTTDDLPQMESRASRLMGRVETDNLIRRGAATLVARPKNLADAAHATLIRKNRETISNLDKDRKSKFDGKYVQGLSDGGIHAKTEHVGPVFND